MGWGEGGGGSAGNNLQMKNNQFRSNAISGRADGQTELCSAVNPPKHTHALATPTKARYNTGDRGRWLQREGQRVMGNEPG